MNLLQANSQRWGKCEINSDKASEFNAVSKRLMSPSAVVQYKAVEARTGVPWWFIAVVHEREASQKWTANIAQGDPWNKKSTHVPVGRGPFKSWEDAAVDALTNCAPYAARNKDWSPAGALTLLEEYNGLGYARKGRPSPYIWAGTNQYTSGKYVRDGVYNPNVVDEQLGCAGLLMTMGAFKSNTLRNTASTGTLTGGLATATVAPHNYWPWIVGGTIVASIVVWLYFHFKGK